MSSSGSSSDSISPGCTIDDGDTTWVLISTVLVLGMMPGLALFEAGLLRSKNTISIMTQTTGGLIILSVLWDFMGFSLVYGPTKHGIIGGMKYGLLLNVSYSNCNPEHAKNIPAAAFAMFQMMFACITPLLITGAVAERLKVKCFFVFCVVWEILVFYPVAHWIWGGGWLQSQLSVLDFAGGIVIHTSAGSGALVLALMLGRRKGFEEVHGEFPPSNIPLAATGGVLLWMGWFGFNAGSALSSGEVAVSTVVSTQIGGAVSGTTWLILSSFSGHNKMPSFVAILNGVIAGLAGITPASGYISTQWTLLVGFLLGVGSWYALVLFKHKLKIDDALDVSSVHGITGVIGSISIGFFCDSSLHSSSQNGLVYGGHHLIWAQIVAVLVTIVYSGIITFLIAKVLDKIWGLRVDEETEETGLDLEEHGETAYHELEHPRFKSCVVHEVSKPLLSDDEHNQWHVKSPSSEKFIPDIDDSEDPRAPSYKASIN